MTEKTEIPPVTEQTPPKTEVKETPSPVVQQQQAAPKETPPKDVEVGAEGDIPEGAEFVRMPKKALKARLESATRSELKALFTEFGVDSKDALKSKLDKLKLAEEKEEADRLAALSREERLAEEKTRAEAQAAEWKTKFEQRVASEEIAKAQTHTSKLLGDLIDPDYLDVELPKLAQFLVGKYSDKELQDLPDSVIVDWAKERVKSKPKLAKDFTGAPPQVERQGLSTTARTETPPAKKEGEGPKDFRPQKGETPEQRRAAQAEIRKATGYNF
jgi:hypothetical protein